MSFGPWWRYVKFREKWNFLSPRKLILKLRGKLWEFLSEKSGGCNNTEGISWHILFYFLRIHIHRISVCVFHRFAIYVRSWQSVSIRKRIRSGAIKFSGQRLFRSIRSSEHFRISAFHISHLHEFLGIVRKRGHLLHSFFAIMLGHVCVDNFNKLRLLSFISNTLYFAVIILYTAKFATNYCCHYSRNRNKDNQFNIPFKLVMYFVGWIIL